MRSGEDSLAVIANVARRISCPYVYKIKFLPLVARRALGLADRLLALDAPHFTLGSKPTLLPDDRKDARFRDSLAEPLEQTILGFSRS